MVGTGLEPPEMTHWEVQGSFLARRGFWQAFSKRCEAASAEEARHWVLSEIGGCHHIARRLIRVAAVTEVAAGPAA